MTPLTLSWVWHVFFWKLKVFIIGSGYSGWHIIQHHVLRDRLYKINLSLLGSLTEPFTPRSFDRQRGHWCLLGSHVHSTKHHAVWSSIFFLTATVLSFRLVVCWIWFMLHSPRQSVSSSGGRCLGLSLTVSGPAAWEAADARPEFRSASVSNGTLLPNWQVL